MANNAYNIDEKTLELTRHAEERFVERNMGYSDKLEIAAYITKNKELIRNRVNKMIVYGEKLFSGRVNNGNFVNVIVHDTWVVMLDQGNKKVITLYRICLITEDEEFNKLFISKMRSKINEKTSKLEEMLKTQLSQL